jgi:hypothetical protein
MVEQLGPSGEYNHQSFKGYVQGTGGPDHYLQCRALYAVCLHACTQGQAEMKRSFTSLLQLEWVHY